jgi:hypothetical protein
VSPIALQWRPDLREQLLEMRTDLLGRMQRRGSIEPGVLPLIAGIAAALEVLDQSAEAAAPAAVDRGGARPDRSHTARRRAVWLRSESA